MTAPDYQRIANEAVDLLCTIGFTGLDPSKRRQFWQQALDLDRQLYPALPKVTVWTPEEGDVNPPRDAEGNPMPGLADAEANVTEAATTAAETITEGKP